MNEQDFLTKIKIPVYPRQFGRAAKDAPKYRALLYPKGSPDPLLMSEHPSREEAEKSIRSWLDMEPEGEGVVEAIAQGGQQR